MLALVDEEGRSRIEPGQFRITVGGCAPGARGIALGAPEPVVAVFTVA
jgi:beta-glucosidase